MAKKSTTAPIPAPVSPDLLNILRDPQAIIEGERYGNDPGRLELVRDAWLVSADTGYKYPIRDGIPVMLVEEGAKWKDTPVADLPVPPPAAEPPAAEPLPMRAGEGVTDLAIEGPAGPNIGLYVAVAALIVALLVLIGLLRRRPSRG